MIRNDDGAHPVDYGVAEVIPHPDYKPPSKYNDIGLLKLSRRVSFQKHIRPACLYLDERLSSSKAVATGWGRIFYGKVLLNNYVFHSQSYEFSYSMPFVYNSVLHSISFKLHNFFLQNVINFTIIIYCLNNLN